MIIQMIKDKIDSLAGEIPAEKVIEKLKKDISQLHKNIMNTTDENLIRLYAHQMIEKMNELDKIKEQ